MSCMPTCFSSRRPNSNEIRVPNFKAELFQRKITKRKSFCVQNENKNEKGVITFEKMLYISLNFSLFLLIFPPFLGIDHLENVSMRYRYPKVLGYRVLVIGIDPALLVSPFEIAAVIDTVILVSILYRVRYLKVSIRYRVLAQRRSSSCMPICFSSCRPNSNEIRVSNFKAEVFQRT